MIEQLSDEDRAKLLDRLPRVAASHRDGPDASGAGAIDVGGTVAGVPVELPEARRLLAEEDRQHRGVLVAAHRWYRRRESHPASNHNATHTCATVIRWCSAVAASDWHAW